LVTWIANPKPLREYLDGFSNTIEEFHFADHHAFNQKDILAIEKRFNELKGGNKIIITTEKDATRIFDMEIKQESIKKYLFYIPLCIKFLNEDKSKFDNQILNYVKKNKRSSNLHNIETDSI
jgi:tetraacyldisaccharide 4'-kinase